MNKSIKEIVDLIEDKEFPARRNISDYIINLLHDLDVEQSIVKLVDNAFDSEYKKRGEQKCLSQTQWKNRFLNLHLCTECKKRLQHK